MKKLRVIHFPQVPCDGFTVEVNSLEEAKKIHDVLADYDFFQYKKRIKPDYSNATVLEQYDESEGEWVSWFDEETGHDDFIQYLEEIEEGL